MGALRFGILVGSIVASMRQFKANGGKLLSYMGWSDVAAGGVMVATDYFFTTRLSLSDLGEIFGSWRSERCCELQGCCAFEFGQTSLKSCCTQHGLKRETGRVISYRVPISLTNVAIWFDRGVYRKPTRQFI